MLILFCGSDTYRLGHATRALIASHREQYGSTLHLVSVDASDEDAADRIERPLKYPSFFGEKKLIVVTNAATAAMAGILKNYKLSDQGDLVLIAVVRTQHESCDKKVLATLSKAADRTESFQPLAGASLAAWVGDYCAGLGTTIETTTCASLAQRTGGDTQLLSNELEKLCAHAQGSVISLQDVQLLTPARQVRDEWELSNALAAYDKRAAISVLWRRLQDGAPEQLLVASVASGIRNLSMVKDMLMQHRPAGVIAAATGIHPFVVTKTMRGAAAADRARLVRAHIGLAQLDRAAKDGRADTVDGLFSVLLSL